MIRYLYFLLFNLLLFLPAKSAAENVVLRTEIKPLIKTEWGQQAPFYFQTPVIDGEHAKTGCVATAFSQVLYYYAYPTQGKPGVYTNTGTTGDFSFDFANNTFDFSLMKEKYDLDTPETDQSALEVSKLMLACGVTVNMNYGVTSSSGMFAMIPKALNEWFLYPSDGLGQVSKECFTNDEWAEIIYDELKEGRPVVYLGGNGTSSHVFVCDGYKDGLFHMNWGWYGERNGYFNLSNLQVERVGDNSLLSLNSSQRIVRGIRLESQATPVPLATASSFGFDENSNKFTFKNISCFSDNTVIVPGVRILNSDGEIVTERWTLEPVTINKSNSNIEFSLSLNNLNDGDYVLRPVFKCLGDDSTIYKVFCNIQNDRFINVRIKDNALISYSGGTDIEVNVAISEYFQNSSFIKGEIYNAGFSVFAENVGNFNITRIGVKLCMPGETEAVNSIGYPESLAPGESRTINLGIPTVNPGEYDMILYDNNTKTQFGEPIRIIIHDGKKIVSVENSPYRYMPLSEDKKEAIILLPASTTASENNLVKMSIDPTVIIKGEEYKITEIGPRLLYNRNDISEIVIPEYVTKIDPSSFASCTNLSIITVKAQEPPVLHPKAFDANTFATATLKVPSESILLYKTAPLWSEFTIAEDNEEGSVVHLSMQSFKIAPGKTAQTTLRFESDKDFYGCQLSMTLPEGLILTDDGISVPAPLQRLDFSAYVSDLRDNKYTLLTYSSSGYPFPAEDTTILEFTFKAESNFKEGAITLTDILLSVPDEENENIDKDFKLNDIVCEVSADFETSVNASENVYNDTLSIYTVSGILLHENVRINEIIHTLQKGLYIVRDGKTSQKLLIR